MELAAEFEQEITDDSNNLDHLHTEENWQPNNSTLH